MSGIIFSPDLIYELCKIITSNKYKYILKTDIITKRYNNFNGFTISLEESNELLGKKQMNYMNDHYILLQLQNEVNIYY